MNETKMLSFEKWRGPRFVSPENEEYAKSAWEHARIGMIPADRAVEIPEAWPEWAVLATGCFYGEAGSITRTEAFGVKVPRPAPVWSPKIGEAVFGWTAWNHTPVWIGRVSSITSDSLVNVICSDGEETPWRVMNLKPFSPESIGKKWSEI